MASPASDDTAKMQRAVPHMDQHPAGAQRAETQMDTAEAPRGPCEGAVGVATEPADLRHFADVMWRLNDLLEVQAKSADHDDYQHGLYNGLAIAYATIIGREARFFDSKKLKLKKECAKRDHNAALQTALDALDQLKAIHVLEYHDKNHLYFGTDPARLTRDKIELIDAARRSLEGAKK